MRVHVLLLAVLVCLPAAAAAQPPQTYPTMKLGGYVQYDLLAPLGEREDADQTFRFRRVRLALTGALLEKIDWSVTVEATNTPVLRDAVVVLKHVPAATVHVGQFVMPYGQEQYVFSSNVMAFTERLLVPLIPSRDAGVMVTNAEPFGGWLTYAAAIINGTGANVRDNNDSKDAILRLSVTPPSVQGLRASVNLARGEQPAGMRTRRGVDVSFERRSFQVAGELLAEDAGAAERDGYYIFGAWRLYPPAPHRAFHHLEFGSRVGRITGPTPLGQWDISLNYYVQPNLRFLCDYVVHTWRAAGSPGRTLHARANFRF